MAKTEPRVNLSALAEKYGSDKGLRAHRYTRLYDMLFYPYRDRKITFLEMGLQIGGPEHKNSPDRETTDAPSVRMWLEYFPKAEIIGLDVSDFSWREADRFQFIRCDMDDREKIREATEELQNLPLYIDDQGGLSISQLSARARRLQRSVGLDLIIIDYLQLITTSGGKASDSRVQEITQITMALKALAKDLNVPIVALSQLSRQVEQRDDKRPQLSDLRESGSIEQDADVVMFVYRESYYLERTEPQADPGDPTSNEKWAKWRERMDQVYGTAEVIIGKQRHGPIGKVVLAFDANVTRFGNLDRQHSGEFDE